MISVDSPQRKMRLSPAIDSIAAGAAIAGTVLGLRARGEKPRCDSEVEPTPSLPDLQLLRFVDESECSASQPHGYSWESVQPPSFAEWVYRDTPRRKGRPPVSGEVSTTSTLGQSTDLRTISESTRYSGKCKRAGTATPSTTAGSTRVPSRASPEEFAPHGLPRPPSRQRTAAGRPRSSMGISEARKSPRTNPKRPQTSMGISQSSSSTSPPPDSTQRPRSCLGFSRGGSPDVISVPPRPQSSTDVYVSSNSTESANLDVRCGSKSEELSVDHARMPTPNTGSCGIESSGVSAALSRSERLNAAAEEAGEKARGEITLAMRARTICRLAGNAASRKLLHLWGEWDCPPASLLAGEESSGNKDMTERAGSVDISDTECNQLQASGGSAGHFNASPLGSIFGGEFPKKRCIKVAANTALGRMVSADPERAAKYDLVTIPAWQLNKPWPPPAIGPRQLVKQADNQRRAKAFEMEEEKIARMERAENRRVVMKKRVAKMQAVTTLVGLGLRLRMTRERSSTRTEDSEALEDAVRSANSTDGFEMADLESAGNILDWAQKEAFKGIFNRYSKHDDYKLTRRGMIKAMREAGLTPTTQEEQRRFAAVQVQVLEATRGEFEEQPENNPLTSPQGRWEMSEFLLVCAALREINLRKLRVANQEASDEFDVPLAEVEELRSVFQRYDSESTGMITAQDMKELLLVVDMKTSDEDFKLLLQSAGLHKERFDFKEFLKLTTSLDSAMKSPVKMVASTSEKKPPSSPIKSTKTLGNLQPQEAATPRSATPRANTSDKKHSLGISSPLKSMRTLGNLQSSSGAPTPRNRSVSRPHLNLQRDAL